jgi:hypothetical protein
MRKYSQENPKKLKQVICNKCGREQKIRGDIVVEGTYMTDHTWNYFSDKDGEIHSFDLCERCYDEIINNFIHPIDIEKRSELM